MPSDFNNVINDYVFLRSQVESKIVEKQKEILKLENDINLLSLKIHEKKKELVESEKAEKKLHKRKLVFSEAIAKEKSINLSEEELALIENRKSQTENTAFLSLVIGENTKKIEIVADMILGRGRDCDFVIHDATVSRNHAKIIKKDNEFFIQDLGSKNGIILNMKKLEPNATEKLVDNSVIIIGSSKLSFHFV